MKPLITAIVAGAPYLLHPQKLGTIQETINPDALIPITLLETDEIFGDLNKILHDFDVYDDVFTPDFGDVLVEKPGANDTARRASSIAGVSRTYQLAQSASIQEEVDFDRLPSGPYFLYGPNLYQAWKLYDDDLDAFAFGVIPENATNMDEFRVMTSISLSGEHKSIPVPSRLYFNATEKQPLAGLRISIPDTMSLSGVPTTLSSKAYAEIQSPADSTAAYAQRLIDQGAVIVGKTKSSQFTTGREWIDAPQPWNPRADGYQNSGSGSPGGAAAVAGYEWFTVAVGQDALDGVRSVAAENGLYSLRSSTGLSLDGVQRSSKTYDAAGFFFRDIKDFHQASPSLLDTPTANTTTPKRLIYPHDFHVAQSPEQQKLTDLFVSTLEKALDTKAEKITISSIWARKAPSEANGQGLQDYLKDAPFKSFCYEFYHEFDAFRSSYGGQFTRAPYIEATPQFQWDTGKKVTKEEYDEYIKRIAIFRKWFDANIFSANKADAIIVLPVDVTKPSYRDEAPGAPKAINGITANLLAPLLQTPQLIIPFAQLPYNSRVSKKTEHRPISASVMGGKDGDIVLLQAIQKALESAKWRATVDTGRLSFPLGDGPRNVDDGALQKKAFPVVGRSEEL